MLLWGYAYVYQSIKCYTFYLKNRNWYQLRSPYFTVDFFYPEESNCHLIRYCHFPTWLFYRKLITKQTFPIYTGLLYLEKTNLETNIVISLLDYAALNEGKTDIKANVVFFCWTCFTLKDWYQCNYHHFLHFISVQQKLYQDSYCHFSAWLCYTW